MALIPVNSTTPIVAPGVTPGARPADGSGDGFSQLFGKFINDANAQQLQSQDSLRQFAAGESDSVHDLVLQVAKADLSFRMVLEIRNKLVESYQEVMRMQF